MCCERCVLHTLESGETASLAPCRSLCHQTVSRLLVAFQLRSPNEDTACSFYLLSFSFHCELHVTVQVNCSFASQCQLLPSLTLQPQLPLSHASLSRIVLSLLSASMRALSRIRFLCCWPALSSLIFPSCLLFSIHMKSLTSLSGPGLGSL